MKTDSASQQQAGHSNLVLTSTPESRTFTDFVQYTRQLDQPPNLVVVVFDLSPDDVLERLRQGTEFPEVTIISVNERTRTTDATTCDGTSSPITTIDKENYARIVTIIDLYLREWETQSSVYFGSLTSLLTEEPWRDIFRFLHLLTSRISNTAATARFHLDPNTVSPHVIHILSHLFDTVEEYPDTKGTLTDSPNDSVPEVITDAVDHELRADALRCLRTHEGPMSIQRLAETLYRSGDRDADDVEELHVALYHIHIPKLVEAGLVITDEDHSTVELSTPAKKFETKSTFLTD